MLERTLDSFLEFNDSPIEQYIISEDDKNADLSKLIEKYSGNFVWLQNFGEKRGMLGNIDFLYKQIGTYWVFHCEDDWEFYRKGFIRESMNIIMHPTDNILQVWLREQNDTNGHPISNEIYTNDYIEKVNYKLVELDYLGCFNGYSTNPGLRRLEDKVCFEALNKLGDRRIGPEGKVSLYYKYAGFRAAITMKGYVKHIGEGRTTL